MKVQNSPKIAWNKNKLIDQKLPLKPEQIWSIRVRLEMQNNIRDLALFNLANQQVGAETDHSIALY